MSSQEMTPWLKRHSGLLFRPQLKQLMLPRRLWPTSKRSQAAGLASKPKELELTGRPEEDRRLWSDWQFSAIQSVSHDEGVLFQTESETHIKSPNPIGMGNLDDDEKACSRQVFSFPAGTFKGRLLAGSVLSHKAAMGTRPSEGFTLK